MSSYDILCTTHENKRLAKDYDQRLLKLSQSAEVMMQKLKLEHGDTLVDTKDFQR